MRFVGLMSDPSKSGLSTTPGEVTGLGKQSDQDQDAQSWAQANQRHSVDTAVSTPSARKKHRRVVRQGKEQMRESEAVASLHLVDDEPRVQPTAQGPNDARLIADVPPHWGKR